MGLAAREVVRSGGTIPIDIAKQAPLVISGACLRLYAPPTLKSDDYPIEVITEGL